MQQSVSALARIVGPVLAGLLFQHVGIPAPYLVGAAGMGVALGLLVRDPDVRPARSLRSRNTPSDL